MNREKRTYQGEPARFNVVLGKAQTHITTRTSVKKTNTHGSPYQYLSIAGDLGFSITVPIVLAFILGSQLDARLYSGHTITFVFGIVGIFISIFSITRRVKDIIRIK